MAIDCLILGAGQEVGKSCVIVNINGKKIMFDCGMHMGHCDLQRYPDFSLLSKSGHFDDIISCVIITHAHSDHIGALPYFTEVCGFSGPIYMTHPTKALAPQMLEEGCKRMADQEADEGQFTPDHVRSCMEKVIAVDLKQTIRVDEDLEIRAYYAGHVIGAAMFYARVGDNAIVYTGDYNMTPDRLLGAAQIDHLQLDLVITESTYATTIRGSKFAHEREFLKAVHKCVDKGGKVLIPTFAVGRTQELCILLEDYWERMNLKVPVYLSGGLTIQANTYSKMLTSWTSQKMKEACTARNVFDFKHGPGKRDSHRIYVEIVDCIFRQSCPNYLLLKHCYLQSVSSFDRSLMHAPGPCVLFATPGMLNSGFSLDVFKEWATSENNLVTLPGKCVSGTVGHKVLMSKIPTKIYLDRNTQIDVRCEIHQLANSAHTDSKGIMDLMKFLSPKHVILVHGEKPKMAKLSERIQSELGIPCYFPANNETVSIPSTHYVRADASASFINSTLCPNFSFKNSASEGESELGGEGKSTSKLQICDVRVSEGILVIENNQKAIVVHQDDWSGRAET